VNIKIKAIERDDLFWILQYRNDPFLMVNFNQPAPLSMAEQEHWFETQILTKKTLAFIVYLDLKKMGYVALQNINWINRSAEISHFIIEGFNYIAFGNMVIDMMLNLAFNSLNLHKVHTVCFKFNPFYEELLKMGFTLEGTIRDHCFKGGQYYDGYLVSIISDEHKGLYKRLQ
jgi:hypothetical protein